MALSEKNAGSLAGVEGHEDRRSPALAGGEEERTRAQRREVRLSKLPWGVWALERAGVCCWPRRSYKVLVYVLTFICYATYHLSRKPFSVVKVVLCPQCAQCDGFDADLGNESNGSGCLASGAGGWPPFNGTHGKTLLGGVDYAELFSYALALFVSGQIADRVNLRYYLTIGLMGITTSVTLLGVAYFAEIHNLWYFIAVQILGGVMQATGWPGVVSVFGSWFGKKRRGLLMGVWNAHSSIGNILSTIIPSFWADSSQEDPPWGWSFLVPAFITAAVSVLIFLFLVPDPHTVDLPAPVHHLEGVAETKAPKVFSKVEKLVESYRSHDPPRSPRPPKRRHNYLTFSSDDEREEKGEAGREAGAERRQGEGEVRNLHEDESTEEERELDEDRLLSSPDMEVDVKKKKKAIGFFRAFLIPGVIEYSLALFFSKLVSYTFLYWLPFYVKTTHDKLSSTQSAWLAAIFDVGGILGAILSGLTSDLLHSRALTCVLSLSLAIPSLFLLRFYGDESLGLFIFLLVVCGMFIIGPYAIITTAVSSDLGNHECLKESQNAKATVTGIIDGTGSLGAAFGPLIMGWVTDTSSWDNAFYILMGSCAMAAIFLARLVFNDVKSLVRTIQDKRYRRLSLSIGKTSPLIESEF